MRCWGTRGARHARVAAGESRARARQPAVADEGCRDGGEGEEVLGLALVAAVSLGRAAVDAGHRLYSTAAGLAAKCHMAALEGRWKTCMRLFPGPRLLIIDELGCAPRGAVRHRSSLATGPWSGRCGGPVGAR